MFKQYIYINFKGKSPDSENNSSKLYGNAFLGQNLWDKNDILQGEKLGVKFETLDFEEFLNENSLNESDVEFLDRIHKVEANNTNKKVPTSNNINNNQQPINVQTSQIQKNTSNPTSPSTSSSISSTSISPNLIISQSNNRLQQQQQQQIDMTPINLVFPSNKISSSSSTTVNNKKNISNWNIDANEISVDEFSVGSYNSNEDYGSNSGSNIDLLDLNEDSQMKMFEMSKKSKKVYFFCVKYLLKLTN
jgi:hypothetical protein